VHADEAVPHRLLAALATKQRCAEPLFSHDLSRLSGITAPAMLTTW
jgi:hypothetical protein